MKKLTLLFAVAILAVTLAACENAPETVSETAETAFENQTIMPKVAETERERPVKELDEEEMALDTLFENIKAYDYERTKFNVDENRDTEKEKGEDFER